MERPDDIPYLCLAVRCDERLDNEFPIIEDQIAPHALAILWKRIQERDRLEALIGVTEQPTEEGMSEFTSFLELNDSAFPLFKKLRKLTEVFWRHSVRPDETLKKEVEAVRDSKRKLEEVAGAILAAAEPAQNDVPTVPVVLILDDAQWAGQNILELIQSISSGIDSQRRLLIVATYWTTEWERHEQPILDENQQEQLTFRRVVEQHWATHRVDAREIGPVQNLRPIFTQAFPNLSASQTDALNSWSGGVPVHAWEVRRWLENENPTDLTAAIDSLRLAQLDFLALVDRRIGQIPFGPIRDGLILISVLGGAVDERFFNDVWHRWQPGQPSPVAALTGRFAVVGRQRYGFGSDYWRLEIELDPFRLRSRIRAAEYGVDRPDWRKSEFDSYRPMFDAMIEAALDWETTPTWYGQDNLISLNRLDALRPRDQEAKFTARDYGWAALVLDRFTRIDPRGTGYLEASRLIDQLTFHRPDGGWRVN